MYTIEDLRNGRCAVINDGTLKELGKVIKQTFPRGSNPLGGSEYYLRYNDNKWIGSSHTTLPTQSVKNFLSFNPQRGDKVFVFNDGGKKVTRIFLTKIEGAKRPYICIDSASEDEFDKGGEFYLGHWKHISQIPKEEVVELTLQDISNGKGKGVPVHLIRIKD